MALVDAGVLRPAAHTIISAAELDDILARPVRFIAFGETHLNLTPVVGHELNAENFTHHVAQPVTARDGLIAALPLLAQHGVSIVGLELPPGLNPVLRVMRQMALTGCAPDVLTPCLTAAFNHYPETMPVSHQAQFAHIIHAAALWGIECVGIDPRPDDPDFTAELSWLRQQLGLALARQDAGRLHVLSRQMLQHVYGYDQSMADCALAALQNVPGGRMAILCGEAHINLQPSSQRLPVLSEILAAYGDLTAIMLRDDAHSIDLCDTLMGLGMAEHGYALRPKDCYVRLCGAEILREDTEQHVIPQPVTRLTRLTKA